MIDSQACRPDGRLLEARRLSEVLDRVTPGGGELPLMAWQYCCWVTYCPPVSASIVLVGGQLANDGHVITSVKTAVES